MSSDFEQPRDKRKPRWWPPKVGAKLRHSTRHAAGGGRTKAIEALLYVLSVFTDKDGEQRIVTAEWLPTKRRWSYEVRSAVDATYGSIWLDGTKKQDK